MIYRDRRGVLDRALSRAMTACQAEAMSEVTYAILEEMKAEMTGRPAGNK